jgi:hypothetical protein
MMQIEQIVMGEQAADVYKTIFGAYILAPRLLGIIEHVQR